MKQSLQGAKIENPRGYEVEAVETLRHLLNAGSCVQRDSRRKDFYEVEGRDEIYYIHVSPVTGNVVLLARWASHPEGCWLGSECAAAWGDPS